MIADFPGIQFRYLIDIFVITMKKIEKVTGYLDVLEYIGFCLV